MKQNVYRVVTIQGNDIIWISPTIYLTKESVISAASVQAKDLSKYSEYTVEDYKGHKWDSCCLKECNRDKWMNCEKLYTITDANGYSKVIGFTSYVAV